MVAGKRMMIIIVMQWWVVGKPSMILRDFKFDAGSGPITTGLSQVDDFFSTVSGLNFDMCTVSTR